MGLLRQMMYPGEFVQPENTVLISQPAESIVTWRETLAGIGALVALLAIRLTHIPGTSARLPLPMVITLAVILMLCIAYLGVKMAKLDQYGRAVLTTTDLYFVKHRKVVSSGPLHLLRGVMSFRPNGSETIEYWVATFENGANIEIYANHTNGKEMADRLARMVPRP